MLLFVDGSCRETDPTDDPTLRYSRSFMPVAQVSLPRHCSVARGLSTPRNTAIEIQGPSSQCSCERERISMEDTTQPSGHGVTELATDPTPPTAPPAAPPAADAPPPQPTIQDAPDPEEDDLDDLDGQSPPRTTLITLNLTSTRSPRRLLRHQSQRCRPRTRCLWPRSTLRPCRLQCTTRRTRSRRHDRR